MKKRTLYSFTNMFLWMILISFLSYPLCAQINPVDLPNGWEVWYDKIPVSGEIRVGILDDFKAIPINKQSFFVQIPEHNEKRLCVLLSSRDGRYKAELSYDIAKLSPGRHEFKWPTTHINRLSRFTAQEVTILCSIGNSCKEDPVYYAYASWDEATDSDTLFVQVNSDIPPRIVIDRGDPSKNSTYDCRKMNVPSSVAFNCLCEIPKTEIQTDSDIFLVKRIRRPGGRVSFIRYPLPIKP